MSPLVFLAVSAIATTPGSNLHDGKHLPYITVPDAFAIALSWSDAEFVTDTETGKRTTIREKSLTGTMVVRERLDEERLVFRINGVDVTDYAFNASTETSVDAFRDLVFEIPEGRAFIEMKIYVRHEKEPVFTIAENFDVPLPVVLGPASSDAEGPALKRQTFTVGDIPQELLDVAPPRYRETVR